LWGFQVASSRYREPIAINKAIHLPCQPSKDWEIQYESEREGPSEASHDLDVDIRATDEDSISEDETDILRV
jgi:hypothetical protein